MTRVFVVREGAGETRVAATPETVQAFKKAGLDVAVEKDAGLAAGFLDADYGAAGAELVTDRAKALGSADLVLGVAPPEAADVTKFKKGAVLVCSMQPAQCAPVVDKLSKAGVTTLALDLMPRITRAQKMDILSSQATVAGYRAVLLAAAALPRMFPLLMTAAGTIRPAKVLVLGAGVAGLQAISTAKRLGAVVEANDIRPAVKEQVESLGGRWVDTGTPPDAETKGGYAKEAGEEFLAKQREILKSHIAESDVVITTAAIPGRKAPRLIHKDMIEGMGAGAVIVDLAVESGGNVEGSKPGERVQVGAVTIIGDRNLPGQAAGDASRMFARNIKAFFDEFVKEAKVTIDLENEVMAATAVTHDGKVRHEGAKEALKKAGS